MAHASAYARAKIGGEDRVDPLSEGGAMRCAAPVERCRVSRQCSRRAAPSPLALSMGAHKHQERSDSTMICPLAKPQGRRRSFVDEVRRRVLARRTSSSRDSSARFARTAFPLLKSTRRAGGGARTGLFHDERATRARDGVHRDLAVWHASRHARLYLRAPCDDQNSGTMEISRISVV